MYEVVIRNSNLLNNLGITLIYGGVIPNLNILNDLDHSDMPMYAASGDELVKLKDDTVKFKDLKKIIHHVLFAF